MSEVKESTIRQMTRLANEHCAVNLSQGFPNEAPPLDVRLALAHAVVVGQPVEEGDEGNHHHYNSLLRHLSSMSMSSSSETPSEDISDSGGGLSSDILNQYSPPMGRGDLRSAISAYYKRLYDYDVDSDNITVTLGATEAVASSLRSLGKPSDKVVIFEPFHELYPSQCRLFYLQPTYVTLRPAHDNASWMFDPLELEEAMKDARLLILNTPHNPTGKVFTRKELQIIVDLCLKYSVYVISDEIYEHMCYSESHGHILLPQAFPEVANLCLICNSLGKSASATGWRLGWCIHPPHISDTFRGIHDQLVVMSPHPVQYAALTYLSLPDQYFREELKERYQGRIKLLAGTLQELGFGLTPVEGAYYLFVRYRNVKALAYFDSPMEAAMYLLEKVGVACVPGDNFYGKAVEEQGNQYLRFAGCRSEADIKEACSRLRAHLG
ncbi:Bifunctional aspartate aminotransferase and glutamate/aspartate-prephenate aminotransferase [Seminavis robusta]|uniref:Bifunctional aspartate aminotransferase and glutamate/aspartate-prephenate aminotransferase n=1 Tax=Seminavis robusta TaxID=568900 RepID=A0A9N8H0H6_9STRA|nr:Bifunctional aspartate aminotransferase and glutamate/aspartate-prephenate aminotransferase [Seminavis robusta]|eukprot:Sro2_g001570.1 Bifunctional aspartate aminotransferase and glutamate/aspartate-prephenate aminotransferase (438) ;mRNA; f:191734-193216